MRFPIRKKLSFFTTVLLAVSIGTAIYLPLSTLLTLNDKFDQNTLLRERRLVHYFKLSEALYLAGAERELDEILREALRQGDINYYVVYTKGNLIYAFPPQHPLGVGNTFEERQPFAGKDLIDEVRSERSEFLSTDVMLTIGIDKRRHKIAWQTLEEGNVIRVLIQEILIVIALAALAFWLHARDLIRLKNEILKTGRLSPEAANQSALSLESEAILATFRGYSEAENLAASKSALLQLQILPALQREIFSGKTPPYTFDCTLVRTDINGFSQIFNSPYRERFAEHINHFFMGLTEIASRYDGLIYEFVGDEAIYYFKDIVSPKDSLERAVDAIRDINLLAEEINQKTSFEGHKFTVKSALAHGTLRFAKLVDGCSLSGGILIETVRILSNVIDKTDNHLYFADRHLADLPLNVKHETIGSFHLKGYSESVVLHKLIALTPLSDFLSRCPDIGFNFIGRFRNDHSLEAVIGTAATSGADWSVEQHLDLAENLRQIQVYRSRHRLEPSLSKWLLLAQSKIESQHDFKMVVSALIMLYPRLVPLNDLSEKTIFDLEALLDFPDGRAVANAIDVLTLYGVTPNSRSLTDLHISGNNRVAANALINTGIRRDDIRLYVSTLKALEKMIFQERDEARIASGIYALGEIGRILRTRDPVYFATRIDLHDMSRRLTKFRGHPNFSISSQAERALSKFESPRTLEGPGEIRAA
jgi:hypothetical protein